MGVVPVQVPVVAVRVCPSWAVPLMVGGELLVGAVGAVVTTAVGAEVATELPLLFVAVTSTRIVKPTSAPTKMYFAAVAPTMTTQWAPFASQSNQRRAKLVGLRVQPPTVDVNVCPTTVVPVIVGREVLTGGPLAANAEGSPAASPMAPSATAAITATLFGFSFPSPTMRKAPYDAASSRKVRQPTRDGNSAGAYLVRSLNLSSNRPIQPSGRSDPPLPVEAPGAPIDQGMDRDDVAGRVDVGHCGHMGRAQHILVLDHEPVWLKALSSTLEAAELKITTTRSATGALKLLRERRFAVAMIGIDSDRFDWQRFLERAKLRAPGCKLIVVSHQDPLATVARALELGADAYVVKRAEPEDLVFAVRQALSPGVYHHTGGPVRLPGHRTMPQQPLTRREHEILRLVAEGCSNAEIASRLSITEPTVKSHLWRLYRKIGVRSRTAAVAWATAARSELS